MLFKGKSEISTRILRKSSIFHRKAKDFNENLVRMIHNGKSDISTRIFGIWKYQIWNPQFLEYGGRSESDIFSTSPLLANALSEPDVPRGSFGRFFQPV